MTLADPALHSFFWLAVTRLGESEILLPAFLAGALWLAFARPAWARGRRAASAHAHDHPARGAALRWVAGIVGATAVTTASKIAFLGFGIGFAAIDFTGFSGHSMYATAILPVLGAIVFGQRGAVAGALLAAVVMVSRVEVGAHSWSEAVSGLVLGGLVAWWTLALYLGHPGAVRVPLLLPIALACWLTVLPWRGPPSHTHGLVVALSLKLSGRTQPYTRHELLHGEIGRVASAADRDR
jgi:membrane-associated phospholipid phosphatase